MNREHGDQPEPPPAEATGGGELTGGGDGHAGIIFFVLLTVLFRLGGLAEERKIRRKRKEKGYR
jgi:hypothetical protein